MADETPDTGTPDLASQVGASGDYEHQQAALAQAAIQQGADPAKVTAKLSQAIHAYRASLGTKPDTSAPEPLTTGEKIAGGIGNAYQGLTLGAGNKITSGIQALSDAAQGNGFDFGNRLKENTAINENFQKAYPKTTFALQTAGSLPTALAGGAALKALGEGTGLAAKGAQLAGFGADAATTGGKAVQLAQQGASTGALAGALSANRPEDVASGAERGAGLGALAGPLAGGTLHLAGNVLGKAGVSNLASTVAGKLGANDLSQSLGARGAVNEAVAPRVELGEQLKAPDQSHAAILDAYDTQTAQEAKPLYDAVRNDKTLIDDPDLQKILKDPSFQKPYQRLVTLRAQSGNPLQQTVDPNVVPDVLSKMGVDVEGYQRMLAKPGAAEKLGALPTNLTGVVKNDIPDPDILHQLKQVVSNTLQRGSDSKVVMTQKEAEALAPMVQQVTDILHEKSPASRLADAYYSYRMGGREALASAPAFVKQGATAIEGENTPEAMTNTLNTPRNRTEAPNTPNSSSLGLQNRQHQFQTGAKAAIMDQAGTKAIEGPADILKLPILENSAQAAKARAVAIPDPQERQAFESWLTDQHAAAADRPATGGGTGMAPFSPRMAVVKGLRTVLRAPDFLNTGVGKRIASQYALNPSQIPANVAAYGRGSSLLQALRDAAAASTASGIAQTERQP